MKNYIHQMPREAMDIIRRSGACSEIEFNYLHGNTLCEVVEFENSMYFQELLIIYLPEIRGYCSIYAPSKTPDNYWNGALRKQITNQIPPAESASREYQQGQMHQNFGHAPYIMRFYDITYSFSFDTYEELRWYVDKYGQNRYCLDPRNDPAFNRIFERGELLSDEDFNIFMKYRNYVIGDNQAVIDLGNGERILFPVSYEIVPNRTYNPYCITHPAQGKIEYEKGEPPKTFLTEYLDENYQF